MTITLTKKGNGVQNFASKVVFLDTAPLIYFIEEHNKYHETLSTLFDLNDKGGFSFITSTITLLEVLVKPIRDGKAVLHNNTETY